MERTALLYYPAGADIDAAAAGEQLGLEIVDVERGDLGAALGRLASGRASVLLVQCLVHAVDSLGALVALLDWLDSAGADLVALDVALDTGGRGATGLVRVLREVDRWGREPAPGRPARGRPGLLHQAPELADRIRALRREGLSLQAIADRLDAEGVPTPRGGNHWRPSSVQAALGYRRPRPPAPGVPPPHPAHRPRHAPPGHHERPGPPGGGP